jgi:hypothetical protein
MNGNRMKRFGIIDFLIPGLVAAALVLLGLSLAVDRRTSDPEKAAEKMGRALEKRMAILDGYAAQALVPGQDDWLGHLDLPEDMVLYRYIDDTLQSWKNQFPVANDDIATRMVFQTIARPRKSLVSPSPGSARSRPSRTMERNGMSSRPMCRAPGRSSPAWRC